MSELTIYHNPKCSKSRQMLAALSERGHEPNVILYLQAPPTAARLAELLVAMGLTPRDVIRAKEATYEELGLGDPSLGDAYLIEQMVAYPILIERPIVVAGDLVKLCRTREAVQEVLDAL